MEKAFTQIYKTHRTIDGFSFTFYCDLCQSSYQTEEIKTDSFVTAFQKGQEVARLYFNRCCKCGKWVCDEHYNEDVMECIECSTPEIRRKPLKKMKVIY